MRVIALFLFGAALVCVQSARAAIIGEAENRYTLEEFAAREGKPLSEVEARFAATGAIECPHGYGSAQLTGDNVTLSTALHLFTKKSNSHLRTCEMKVDLAQCNFRYKIGERQEMIKLSHIVNSGCRKATNNYSLTEDWAVIRLAKPATGIIPFKIPPAAVLQSGTPIIAISGGAADFERNVQGRRERVKHYTRCSIRQTWPPMEEYQKSWVYVTDCSSAGGSSGGAIIATWDGDDYLVGVSSHSRGMALKIRDSIGRNGPAAKQYDFSNWSSAEAAVSPAFRDALLTATGAANPSAVAVNDFDISSAISVTTQKNSTKDVKSPVVFSRCDEKSGMRVGNALLIVDGKAISTLLDVQIAVNLAKARKQRTINVVVTGEGGFRRGSLNLD